MHQEISLEELDTWKVCDTIGGKADTEIHVLEASCKVQTDGPDFLVRVIEVHPRKKIIEVWARDKDRLYYVAKADIGTEHKCVLGDGYFMCTSDNIKLPIIEIRRFDGKIRANIHTPPMSFYAEYKLRK